MTFTILGFCEETGRLGAGVATYSLGAGGLCPFAVGHAGVGAAQRLADLDRLAFSNLQVGNPLLRVERQSQAGQGLLHHEPRISVHREPPKRRRGSVSGSEDAIGGGGR